MRKAPLHRLIIRKRRWCAGSYARGRRDSRSIGVLRIFLQLACSSSVKRNCATFPLLPPVVVCRVGDEPLLFSSRDFSAKRVIRTIPRAVASSIASCWKARLDFGKLQALHQWSLDHRARSQYVSAITCCAPPAPLRTATNPAPAHAFGYHSAELAAHLDHNTQCAVEGMIRGEKASYPGAERASVPCSAPQNVHVPNGLQRVHLTPVCATHSSVGTNAGIDDASGDSSTRAYTRASLSPTAH